MRKTWRSSSFAFVFVTVAVVGCSLDEHAGQRRDGAAEPSPSVSVPSNLRDFRSSRDLVAVSKPHRLRIPSLRVDTTLEYLRRRADKTVEVPRRWQRAGWYEQGPAPGEPAAAVILGHVDSPNGPAVFADLGTLRTGARVYVDLKDGSAVTFRVTRVRQYPRAHFPTSEVYLPTLVPELRLITCGGRYIRGRGGYQSNVVVYASAIAATSRLWLQPPAR